MSTIHKKKPDTTTTDTTTPDTDISNTTYYYKLSSPTLTLNSLQSGFSITMFACTKKLILLKTSNTEYRLEIEPKITKPHFTQSIKTALKCNIFEMNPTVSGGGSNNITYKGITRKIYTSGRKKQVKFQKELISIAEFKKRVNKQVKTR